MKLQEAFRHGIFFLAAVSVLSLFMAGIVHSKDEVKLTPEFLASGKWVIPDENSDDGHCQVGEAKFTVDGHYTLSQNCENIGYRIDASGSYKITGNKITFIIENSPDGTYLKKGKTYEAVLSGKNSLEYKWYIQFTDKNIYLQNNKYKIKEGESLVIHGIDAVAMGSKNGTVTVVLKIREAPGTSSKEVVWQCDGSESDLIKSIEKGKLLTVFARTKEKDKVGKLENYWYYVMFNTGCEDSGSIMGWVFGEFVKMK